MPIGCEQSAPGVLRVAWIVQAARYTVLLSSCSRTISRPQPCTCVIIGTRVNGGGDLPGAACCMPRRSKRGVGTEERKEPSLFLTQPIVLLPPFACQPRTSQHGWLPERGSALLSRAFCTGFGPTEVQLTMWQVCVHVYNIFEVRILFLFLFLSRALSLQHAAASTPLHRSPTHSPPPF